MIRLPRAASGSRVLLPVVLAALVVGTAGNAEAQSSGQGAATKPAPGAPAKGAPAGDAKRTDGKEPQKAETQASVASQRGNVPVEETPDHPKEEEEAKRAVTLSADVGFTRMDLGGLSDSLNFDKTGANGVTWSVGAGLRLNHVKVGLRWRVFDTTEFDFWSFMVEAGYSLALRPVSPGITAHLGYVFDQDLKRPLFASSLPGQRLTVLDPDIDVKGALVGAEVNAAYWIGKVARVGAFLGFDLLFLSRPQAGLPGSTFPLPDEIRAKPLYTESGSGIGYTFTVGIRGAADIGF